MKKTSNFAESHIDTVVKNDKGNTLKDNILSNLHKSIEV